jgi:hypothetical protein
MNLTEKIKNSWWVILSFIIFLNGLGFMYIGFKHNNRNWILEGITYEFPWFFYFIIFAIYGISVPSTLIITFSVILMLISIIRSVWVAVKLADVYDNNEKYTIKQTNLNQSSNSQNKGGNPHNFACCLCMICIFIIFLVIIF